MRRRSAAQVQAQVRRLLQRKRALEDRLRMATPPNRPAASQALAALVAEHPWLV